MKSLLALTELSSELIGLIYESAFEAQWAPKLLQVLQQQLGAACVQVQVRHLPTGEVAHSQLSDDSPLTQSFNQLYTERWAATDPLAALLTALPSGEVRRCHELFDERFIAGNHYYQHFLIPHGMRWGVGGVFHSGLERATLVTAFGPVQSGPFKPQAAAILRQLLPHFQRACSVRMKVERRTQAMETATELLRQLPTAYLLTDQFGRCMESNDAFRESAGKLALRLVMGRARFAQAEQQDAWEQGLQETFATGVQQTVRAIGGDGLPWSITLKPWSGPREASNPMRGRMILAVFEARAAAAAPSADLEERRSRLTRAELEVLAGLLQGLPAKSIAGQRGASVNTVRSQIMAILEKTGFSSQRELIASFGASGFSGFSESSFRHSASRHANA